MQALSLDDAFRIADGRPLAETNPHPAYAYPQGSGPASPHSHLTVGDLLRANLEDMIQRCSPSSKNVRICHTKKFLRLWGHLKADQLTANMITQFALDRKKQASDATVKIELALISRAYNLAIDRDYLLTNPTVRAKPRVKLKPKKRVQVLTPDLEEQLRQAYLVLWGEEGEKLWLYERFAILTGLRIGEQAHLQPCHFQQAPGYVMAPEEGKTGARPVPLCKEARDIAERFLGEAAKNDYKWVFWPNSKANTRWGAAGSHVTRRFKPACDFIGLTGYHRSRDLRRTFASRLIAAGVGIFTVQKLLGHTNTNTTQIYCQLATADLSASVTVFDQGGK